MTRFLVPTSAFIISFAATMIAIWFFQTGRPSFGAYNFAIAFVALLTFIAARMRA